MLTSLSRVHAIMERQRPGDRDLTLVDFDSANGLFHRDRRIRSIACAMATRSFGVTA